MYYSHFKYRVCENLNVKFRRQRVIKHTDCMTFEKRFRVMTIAMNYAEMVVNWAGRLPLNFESEIQVSKVGNRKQSD